MARLSLGAEVYRTSRGPRTGKLLREQTFQTSLEDANLVGNVTSAKPCPSTASK